MKVSLGSVGELDFSDWFLGLWSALISGGASAVSSGFANVLVDPDHFTLKSGKLYGVMATAFVVGGVLNGMNFLRSRPAPERRTVETVVKTVDRVAPTATVTTTVKETRVEPIAPPPPK